MQTGRSSDPDRRAIVHGGVSDPQQSWPECAQAQAAGSSGLAEDLCCPNSWLQASPHQSPVPQEPVGTSIGYWPPHHLPGLAFILQCSKKFSWETPFFLTAKHDKWSNFLLRKSCSNLKDQNLRNLQS